MVKKENFSIIREPDDKLALRASIGGRAEIGYYCVFRGDPKLIDEMLENFVPHIRNELRNGRYTDNRGRPQG